jgi:general secretion pathway protein G
MRTRRKTRGLNSDAGFTLLELIVSCAILATLATMAIPIARYTALRERENELKRDLQTMREAIDRYKDLADHGQIRVDALAGGYPPDLQTLVKGVPLTSLTGGGKTIHFLRRIPVDPITRTNDWGLRSSQDEPDATTWGTQNVFDVYSKSTGTAMNGTKYSEW